MSDIRWTADQKKIIETRDCNILVSAAAGSGKTAVLVERIFRRIMDEKDPVNVDQFLVVTFTKAAAAQMKERLRVRIEQEIERQPDNEHLQRQIGLLSSAQISTIHSFCNYVIQNYFHRIGLDPSFRQASQTEIDLIWAEVLDTILEEEYSSAKADFVELADMSELNRHDDAIEEMIKTIYEEAMSHPFPLKFLDRMEQFLNVENEEDWQQMDIVRQTMAESRERVETILAEQKEVEQLCREPGGPLYYEEHVAEIGGYCEALLQTESYEKWQRILSTMSFRPMRKKKEDGVDEEIRLETVARRNECKKQLQNIYKESFSCTMQECLEDLHHMSGKIRTLLRLTKKAHEQFQKEKREKNVVDFNDLEQLALEILLTWDEQTQTFVRTQAACELAEHFVEIMIDEYQDSNRVQDALLGSVSREGLSWGHPNVFMVGDVKQSIYRFRGGCPQLFSEKLDRYSQEENAEYRRIDLHQNFRSRKVVLEAANEVFRRVMKRDVGGVEYDDKAVLHAGREYESTDLPISDHVEVYALLGRQNPEAEGYVIAQRIREMVKGGEPLFIEDKTGYRQVEYRDIVVLVLAHAQGQILFEALSDADIPVVMERKQGFYETREISLMVSMLRVIDNPHQDIPLASVLLGPMFFFTEEELADVRVMCRDTDLYDALCQYSAAGSLYDKIQHFLNVLEGFREKVTYAAVSELVQDIYDVTGIDEAVMMMKDGVQRKANMDSLMEQARQFDATTYHGLYQFVRYLEQIRQQTEEAGEVNLVGEEENVVRIMTIHKSKGLEFPVCFVAGMGKKLNLPHTDFLSIHPDIGIAAPVIDNAKRTRKKNFYTRFIDERNKRENTGECIRKLYVAMTRVEEKLILVGCVKDTETKELDYEGRRKINTMFDMVLPAIEEHWFECHEISQEYLLDDMQRELVREALDYGKLYNFDTTVNYNEKIREHLLWMEAGEEHQQDPLPVKVSVSDLKVQSMEDKDLGDFTILTHDEEETELPIPAFMQQEGEKADATQGAAYGTIWHQVMATIDFERAVSADEIKNEITRLVTSGRLRKEEEKVLRVDRLLLFFESKLGRQMRKAAQEGCLHREQPFVMGRKANEIFPDRQEEDTVLVQGIIDGYFETEDGIVLMDYKTDSLRQGEEALLIGRYKTQMDLYRQALQEMTGKKVIRCVLYSFSLGKEVEL